MLLLGPSMERKRAWGVGVLGAMALVGCGEPLDHGAHLFLVGHAESTYAFDIELDVYFPEGHEPGDPVLMERRGGATLLGRAVGEIDDAGRAVVPLLCGDCRIVLEPGAACATLLATEATVPIQWSGDQLLDVTAGLPFCITEGAAPRGVAVHGAVAEGGPGLIEELVVDADTLLPSSLAGAVLVHDGVDIALTYEGDWFGGRLRLATPVEPTGAFELALQDAANAAGDAASVGFEAPLTTSATVTDLDFVAAPPEGSIATFGYPLAHVDGGLVLTDEGRAPRHAFAALIALGDPGTATAVRWTARHAIRAGGPSRASLYREGGLRSATVSMQTTDTLPIPVGEGALWLVITNDQNVPMPTDRADAEVLVIESIALE